MALLDEILDWTERSLTPWQRDAARRLFQKQDLDPGDYDDLYAMLKAEHGLSNSCSLHPVPLDASHLPVHRSGTAVVTLKALRDLSHVNRIAPRQNLRFAPSGITVIYGDNSSGKSGYSRVLKRACRARDQEEVLPDVTELSSQNNTPVAIFDIETEGHESSVVWKEGAEPPPELATVAVFDSRCARVYLTKEQDIAFLPYGLDVIENLANKVIPELDRRLDRDLAAIDTDTQFLSNLHGDTEVGKVVATLSDRTDPETVRRLATMTEEETKRFLALDRVLSEGDPRAKAKTLFLSAERLKGLASRISSAVSMVDEESIVRLKAVAEAEQNANMAERLAAETLRSNERLLAGTGEAVWRSLFEAAKRFSAETAYPGEEFPHVGEEAVCVLCQQPVQPHAVDRLKRFEEFVRADASRVASELRERHSAAQRQIENVDLSFHIDNAVQEELESLEGGLFQGTRSFEESIFNRRKWMLATSRSMEWNEMPSLTENPSPRIRSLAARQLLEARTLERAADDAKRSAIQREHVELLTRRNLSPMLDAILGLIDRLRLKASLSSCKGDLKTRQISDKARDLAGRVVTHSLREALDEEFRSLGISHIRTNLKHSAERAKVRYQLLLDAPTRRKLEDILSEGEQRAIAIGSFFAELRLADHRGGIIFDDPVSSLDHHRRQAVARRLVEEARHRQVVVLTHDTVFLGELRDKIEQCEVDHEFHFLEWLGERPGNVKEGLPWGHMGYRERIDVLEKAQKEFEKKPWPAYPNETESADMRHQYDLLRSTIERVVQDVVFNGVIVRYRDWIKVHKLSGVVGLEETEFAEIGRLHQRCSGIVEAHDPSSGKNSPVPSALELRKDIEKLKAVIASILTRRRNAAKASG